MTAEGWLLLGSAPFAGSFLGVLVWRLPADGTLWGRSRCPCCGHALAAWELVPLLSYAFQRARCRHCAGAIDPFHPLIEAAALAVAAWAVLLGPGEALLADCLLGWTLLALAWIDWETMLLPDALTLPLVLAGLAEGVLGGGTEVPERALGAALGWAGLAGLAWLWRRLRGIDALGGGDAKLLAAGGAWLGWTLLPSVLLIAALAGIASALVQSRGRGTGLRPLAFGPWLALAIWIARLHLGDAP